MFRINISFLYFAWLIWLVSIESFMHIVNDWLEETNIAMLSQGASDSQASSFQNEGGEAAKGAQ